MNYWILGTCISNLIFNIVFASGLVIGVIAGGRNNWGPLVLTIAIYLLGVGKSHLRLRAVELMLPEHRHEIDRDRIALNFTVPVVALIFLYNLIGSARTNRITWRGITYELRSVNETAIAPEG